MVVELYHAGGEVEQDDHLESTLLVALKTVLISDGDTVKIGSVQKCQR